MAREVEAPHKPQGQFGFNDPEENWARALTVLDQEQKQLIDDNKEIFDKFGNQQAGKKNKDFTNKQ